MPRTAHGALIPALLEPGGTRLGRRAAYRRLRDAIAAGSLAPGARLPSTRSLSREYGMSRTTVEDIYGELEAEGLVRRVGGSGSFVADELAVLPAPAAALPATPPSAAGRRSEKSPAAAGQQAPQAAGRLSSHARELTSFHGCREPERPLPFNAGVADVSVFPWERWRRATARAQSAGRHEALLGLTDPQGLPRLREALARHLQTFRGVRCSAGQVIVFTSSQQALVACGQLLARRGQAVWLEDPCYPGTRAAMALAQARVVPVPVDDEGLRVDLGRRAAPRACLAFVTPSHQYPSGATMSLERRVALLRWAAERGAWIVEDDYDGEFRYSGRPLTAIQGLDRDGRVIFLGSFNKALFPGLRLAYAVVPWALIDAFVALRTQLDGFPPALAQAALAEFLERGDFESHVRHMRGLYAGKHFRLRAVLAEFAGDGVSAGPSGAGFHLVCNLPDAGSLQRTLAAAPAHGLSLTPLADFFLPAKGEAKGAPGARARPALLLRYAGLPESDFTRGLDQLRACLRSALGHRGATATGKT